MCRVHMTPIPSIANHTSRSQDCAARSFHLPRELLSLTFVSPRDVIEPIEVCSRQASLVPPPYSLTNPTNVLMQETTAMSSTSLKNFDTVTVSLNVVGYLYHVIVSNKLCCLVLRICI